MADETVPAGSSFNLTHAVAVLDSWLSAHDEGALDVGCAQQTLRAVHEVMLDDWPASAEEQSDKGFNLMYGVALVRLAEQSAWALSCQADGTARPAKHIADTVRAARGFLASVQAAHLAANEATAQEAA